MTLEYYESLVQQTMEQANSLINNSSAETDQKKMDMLNLAQSKIEDCYSQLGEMKNLMIILPPNEKVQAQRRVQLIDTRIKELQGRIETGKQRAKLFSNISLDPLNNSESQAESLARTQGAIGTSNEIGKGILSTLKGQHQKLENAKMNADQIKMSVANTASHVSNMEKIARQNKMIVYLIIGLLIIGIFLLLFQF